MAEYIEREEIYRRWKEIPPEESLEGLAAGILHMSLAVVQTPAADVAPVLHGRWDPSGRYKFSDGSIAVRCTKCGCALREKEYMENVWNYCPVCGAKMDLEEKL